MESPTEAFEHAAHRGSSFAVSVAMTIAVLAVLAAKVRSGVPRDLASCHTAQVGGYVVEGHVPAGANKRLLTETPRGVGLSVPGMPAGSAGMEVAGREPSTYDVVLFGPGLRSMFARYRGSEAL